MALERKGALGKTYTNAKALWYDWLDHTIWVQSLNLSHSSYVTLDPLPISELQLPYL